MVCPLAPLPGRGARERLPHRIDLCPWIGAKMPQARRKVVDREVAGSDRGSELTPVQWRGDGGAGASAGGVSCDCGRTPPGPRALFEIVAKGADGFPGPERLSSYGSACAALLCIPGTGSG